MIQRAASILKMKDGSLLPLEIRYNFYHLSSSSAMFRFEVQLTTRHSFLNCARSLNDDMAEWSGKVYEVPFFLTPEYDGEKRTFCAQLETYKWDLQLFKRTLINHFLQSAWFFIYFFIYNISKSSVSRLLAWKTRVPLVRCWSATPENSKKDLLRTQSKSSNSWSLSWNFISTTLCGRLQRNRCHSSWSVPRSKGTGTSVRCGPTCARKC